MADGGWSGSTGVTVVGSGLTCTVTGGSGGAATVYYTITSPHGCGAAIDSINVTVNPFPTVYPIAGVVSLCSADTGTLLTDATSGGVWTVADPSIASVDSGGFVSPVGLGSVWVYYAVSNACGITVDSIAMTVNQTPVAGTISGMTPMCPGNVTTYTTSGGTGGGRWSANDTLIANITPVVGTVTALSPGVDTIYYVIATATCGTAASVPFILTVNPEPNPGVVTPGSGTVCEGSTTVFADAAPGGVWSVSNTSVATINTVGLLSGLTVGLDTVYYTVTNSCGTNYATPVPVVVNPLPNAGAISGTPSLCVGTGQNFTATVTGGTWGLTNPAGTISATGVVTGAGPIYTSVNDTVTYSVTNSCGTAVATETITINPVANAGRIFGSTWHVCQGDSIVLYDTSGLHPGYWASSITSYGIVSTVAGDSAVVVGLTPGVTVITYHFNNYCGDSVATDTITVRPTGHCEDDVVTPTMAGEISIYPNPAVSTLHIDAPLAVNVSVVSTDGKVIFQQKNASDIDVSNLANGLYMIMIYDKDNALLKVAKFVKAN